MTDRAPELDEQGNPGYGHKRSFSMAFGSAEVKIGAGWVQLAQASRQRTREEGLNLRLVKITESGRFPETPFPFTIVAGKVVEDERSQAQQGTERSFREALKRRLALTPRQEVLIYVHGYNEGFETAAFTLAEIWHFMGREGVALLYTWPAGCGGLTGYAYDRESGGFTTFHLKQLLRALASFPEIDKVHLLAHSRGADVVVSAVRELVIETRAAGHDPRARYRIANLILAAPDLDIEVMTLRIIAERLGRAVGQVTIYTSKSDRAIALAEQLFGSVGRLGRARASMDRPARSDWRINRTCPSYRGFSALLVWLIPRHLFTPVLILQVVLLRVLVEHLVLGIEARTPFALFDEVTYRVGHTWLRWRLLCRTWHGPSIPSHDGHAFGDLVLGDVPDHQVAGNG